MVRVMAVSHSRDVMGTEHSLLNLAPALADRGVNVMLAAGHGGELEKRWRSAGLTFVPVDLPERSGVRTSNGSKFNSLARLIRLPFLSIAAMIRIAVAAHRIDADLIHSNSILTHIDCAVAGYVTRRKALIELHDIVAPGIGRVLLGVAVALSSSAVATSNAVRSQLPRWARRRTIVIPQGIDIDRFERDGPPTYWRNQLTASPEGLLLAAVGRIDPEKGLDTLVRAAAELRRQGVDAHIALVGAPSKDDGSYLDQLQCLAEQLLPGAFRTIPPVEDVAAVLRSVDVVACPSLEEPFGLIILEAQACGVPVVVSAAGGPLDFITDRVTGMLVPPGDPGATAAAIEELVADSDMRAQMVTAARNRVEREFTATVRAERFAQVYRELLR